MKALMEISICKTIESFDQENHNIQIKFAQKYNA